MATLSTSLILQKSLAAFAARFPMLRNMATDFSIETPVKLNETVIAHVQTMPSASTYDSTTGYANGATETRGLLVDLPIVVDQHQHVPLLASHLYAIADQKQSFDLAIGNAVFVLGKAIVDSIAAKFKGSNLSYSKTYTAANSDMDVIEEITATLNENGAAPTGRIGLVSSAVATTLALDSRVASKDYYGQQTGGEGLRVFRNVGGFSAIYEWPGFATNNAAGQVFTTTHASELCTATAHGFKTGDRVRLTTATTLPTGYAANTTYYVIRISADTFKLASSDANATAGTAVAISDDGTGDHTVTGYENVIGAFFEPAAIAIRAGIPAASHELAAMLGIPQTMAMEAMVDPDSGFPMAMMKWMQPGTANIYLSPTSIWGSAVGRQAGAAAAITDKAAVLLRSA